LPIFASLRVAPTEPVHAQRESNAWASATLISVLVLRLLQCSQHCMMFPGPSSEASLLPQVNAALPSQLIRGQLCRWYQGHLVQHDAVGHRDACQTRLARGANKFPSLPNVRCRCPPDPGTEPPPPESTGGTTRQLFGCSCLVGDSQLPAGR